MHSLESLKHYLKLQLDKMTTYLGMFFKLVTLITK